MAAEIVFPDREIRYVFERDCLAFSALVDGKPVECLITAELLMQRFGARDFSEGQLREAFEKHKSRIQEIVRQHIEMGWITPENQLILTTRFTNLKVTMSPELRQWSEGFSFVQKAFRKLAEIIGPNAGEVNVEWDRTDNLLRCPAVILRISDLSGTVSGAFVPQDGESPVHLQVRLARLWGDVLQIRSRNLLLKSG